MSLTQQLCFCVLLCVFVAHFDIESRNLAVKSGANLDQRAYGGK